MSTSIDVSGEIDAPLIPEKKESIMASWSNIALTGNVRDVLNAQVKTMMQCVPLTSFVAWENQAMEWVCWAKGVLRTRGTPRMDEKSYQECLSLPGLRF